MSTAVPGLGPGDTIVGTEEVAPISAQVVLELHREVPPVHRRADPPVRRIVLMGPNPTGDAELRVTDSAKRRTGDPEVQASRTIAGNQTGAEASNERSESTDSDLAVVDANDRFVAAVIDEPGTNPQLVVGLGVLLAVEAPGVLRDRRRPGEVAAVGRTECPQVEVVRLAARSLVGVCDHGDQQHDNAEYSNTELGHFKTPRLGFWPQAGRFTQSPSHHTTKSTHPPTKKEPGGS